MLLLAISDPEFIPNEAEIINNLFGERLECLHIRKSGSNKDDFRKLLSEINTDFLDKISIHQHHALAAELGIKRLHFTENNRRATSFEKLKWLMNKGFSLSTSIHNLNELESLPPLFNYTFFGPVFDSISKADYKSTLPNDFYLEDKMKKIPVIGLGGIDSTNLKQVKEMNFDGAAVLGALWKNPEKGTANFRSLMEMII